ncbi:MAG: HAD family hydrolase [Pirellulales bacterium]|nr:HAD family hydrolase [Pirellulales bacterium]
MVDAVNGLDAVLRLRTPMSPIATDVVPELKLLGEVRAVIFDVYGTLLISGSGDVGTVDQSDRDNHLLAAFRAVGWGSDADRLPSLAELHQQIRVANDGLRSETCPHPEVDIIDVWRQTLIAKGCSQWAEDTSRLVALAAEYEGRANPTWPMPGAEDLIGRLGGAGYRLGIVSNAQAFTLPLVGQLTGIQGQAGEFDLDLCVYSYRYRQAKPGPRLFDVLRAALRRRGIEPGQAVYVGNDMLNDVWAASQAGLRTAWFAGDARSCRPRDNDPRCRSLRPDIVLTKLVQLLDCVQI